MTIFLLILCSYLLGAIPFALLTARINGIDIRKVGSGNVGATNVFRAVGKGWGVLTFGLDVLKGFLPTFLFPILFPVADPTLPVGLLYGCAAVAGHNWPVYLGFKGGKGVATSVGMLLGAAPASVGVGLIFWILTFVISRYVSLASMVAAVAIAASGWWLYGTQAPPVLAIVLTILSTLVIWRHRSNIERMCKGTEHRFGKSKSIREAT
jgi:acyl phosphate:glycerol-3-phosphate acyltransferase